MSINRPIIQDDQPQYYAASKDPHTAIPDWIPFCRGIGPDARNLISATLVLQKVGTPPTRRELARALDVDERTIYRWTRELASAGVMSVQRQGRRMIAVFHRPKPDNMITDRTITDHAISDRPVRFPDSRESPHAAQARHETAIPDRSITDRPVVGVGDHVLRDSDSPTSTRRAPLKTALARWAKQYGMVAARDIDDPALDYATYKRWIEDKRAMGWEWRQIVSTLRDAPLDQAAPLDQLDQAAPLDLTDDELRRFKEPDRVMTDSTSLALARRYDRDRAEAAARGAGLVNEKGKRT